MVKLTKCELARRKVRDIHVEIRDGDRLGDLVESYGPDVWVDVDYGYYDDPVTYWLVHEREENDEEYNARIEIQTAAALEQSRKNLEQKKKRYESERKIYERLKKKYEKTK